MAQTSASYKLTEFAWNAGGDPRDGMSAASASYHISLDAIGDPVAASGIASAGYRGEAGFVGGYPPPGEVGSVHFVDKTKLAWAPDRSVGTYAVYRDLFATLPGAFGACLATGLTAEAATDPTLPSIGQGYFYLVTAGNLLREEGTKGSTGTGTLRSNPSPCP